MAVNLRITGPTPLPPEVLEAMGSQMVSHRGDQFRQLLTDVVDRLRPLFGCRTAPLPFTASGTGGLEAAVVNLIAPGDRVLALSAGYFGERFADVARTHGASVAVLDCPPGRTVDPAAVRRRLRRGGCVEAVLLTHNETSTGVLNDLPALARAVREESDALVLADGVSSVGCTPVRMDAWGVDVVVTATQKALMSPPGLVILALSERASDRALSNRRPRYYFDVGRMAAAVAEGSTTYTPAIPVVFALRAALELIEAEGLDAVYARHRRIAALLRAGVERLGLTGFADPAHLSPALTSALVPDGCSATGLRRRLQDRHGVYVNTGRGELKDRLLRIGHMGHVSEADAACVLDALEAELQ